MTLVISIIIWIIAGIMAGIATYQNINNQNELNNHFNSLMYCQRINNNNANYINELNKLYKK